MHTIRKNIRRRDSSMTILESLRYQLQLLPWFLHFQVLVRVRRYFGLLFPLFRTNLLQASVDVEPEVNIVIAIKELCSFLMLFLTVLCHHLSCRYNVGGYST